MYVEREHGGLTTMTRPKISSQATERISEYLGTTASFTLTKHGESTTGDIPISHPPVLPGNGRIIVTEIRSSLHDVRCYTVMRDSHRLQHMFRSGTEQRGDMTYLRPSGCSTGKAQESQLRSRLAFSKPPFDKLRPIIIKVAESALNK